MHLPARKNAGVIEHLGAMRLLKETPSIVQHTEIQTYDANAFAAQALSSPEQLAAVIDHTLLKPDAT